MDRSRRRVLLGKVGLDGHDRGVKVVARLLRGAGLEVIYTGLRSSPEALAAIAVAEDVDVIGVSILSGSHIPQAREVVRCLEAAYGDDERPLLTFGGTIPKRDERELTAMGVDMVFGVGSDLNSVLDWFLLGDAGTNPATTPV